MASGKKTKGRQKIEIKEIERQDERLITFSKRRAGINKKLSEIITLCGADVAFLVFSPSGKTYSFGHPSIETVTNRFLGRENLNLSDNIHDLVEAHRQIRTAELVEWHNEVLHQLDAEKEYTQSMQKLKKNKEPLGWWDAPIEGLNQEEVHNLHKKFIDQHQMLLTKINERNTANHSSSSWIPRMNSVALGINPFAPGGSGNKPINNASGPSANGLNLNTHLNVFAPGSSVNDPRVNSFAPGPCNNNFAFFSRGESQADLTMNYLAPSMDWDANAILNTFFPSQGNPSMNFLAPSASESVDPSQKTIFPSPGFGFDDENGEF